MDFEKLAKQVEKLERSSAGFGGTAESRAQAMKNFAETVRDILTAFLKERREPIRPGHLFRDAAAKGFVPGDIADRGENLLIRWAGRVTPRDEKTIAEDAGHMGDVAAKLLPVLKAYRKEEEKPEVRSQKPEAGSQKPE
ncbi:MAG: hypothetical protein HY716_14755 [Planctomycetes bacterium]|nr:hypothetical protein [Planctomycetota bacterium]